MSVVITVKAPSIHPAHLQLSGYLTHHASLN